MKKVFCLIFSVILFSTGLFAQENTKKVDPEALREKVLKKKLAFYAEKLKLSKGEYDKFVPIYSQYDKELFDIGAVSHQANHKLKGDKWQNIKADEADELLKQFSESEKQAADVKIAYVEKFKSVLPAKKVAKLMIEERSIMRKVMKGGKLKGKDYKHSKKEME